MKAPDIARSVHHVKHHSFYAMLAVWGFRFLRLPPGTNAVPRNAEYTGYNNPEKWDAHPHVTADPDEAIAWLDAGFNVGCLPGPDTCVVDTDTPEATALFDEARTLTVRTPRGKHRYFAGDNAAKVVQASDTTPAAKGVDTRASRLKTKEGYKPSGYVIGPGSKRSLADYEKQEKQPPPGSEPWHYEVDGKVVDPTDVPDEMMRHVPVAGAPRKRKRTVDPIAEMRAAKEGSRNDTLNRLAYLFPLLANDLIRAAIEAGLTEDEARATTEGAAKSRQESDGGDPEQGGSNGGSVAAKLVRMALDRTDRIFHDPSLPGRRAFADMKIEDRRETWAVGGRPFADWLRNEWRRCGNEPPPGDALKTAIAEIQAIGRGGDPVKVWMRVGMHNGNIYHDLGRPDWLAVEIRPEGWGIVKSVDHECRFMRTDGMLPLPLPTGDGDIQALRLLLPDGCSDESFTLIAGWLLGAFHPPVMREYEYAFLAPTGPAGSGKTGIGSIVQAIIDPHNIGAQSWPPKSTDDYQVAVQTAHLLLFDNISRMSQPWSDELCRLSTGSASVKRALYTDGDVYYQLLLKPAVLTGIDRFIDREDLADRCISVVLEPMKERRSATEQAQRIRDEAPVVRAAIYDAAAHALRHAGLPPEQLPRMASFAAFVDAGSAAWGNEWDGGQFLDAYRANHRREAREVVDADPVADAIRRMMTADAYSGRTFRQYAKQALEEIGAFVPEDVRKSAAWPKSSGGLGKRFNKLKGMLAPVGICLSRTIDMRGTLYEISTISTISTISGNETTT